jgi:hypothetical protein
MIVFSEVLEKIIGHCFKYLVGWGWRMMMMNKLAVKG